MVASGFTKSLITMLVVATVAVGACSSDRRTLALKDLKLGPCPAIRAAQVDPDMLHVEIHAVAGGKVGRRLNSAPFGANPVASPDGRSIAYEAAANYSDGLGLIEPGVNVVGVNGEHERVLTREPFALVAWKPAGIIAKRRLDSDNELLVVVDPLTGSVRTLWEAPGRIEVVGWSRAATAIATVSVGDRTELWTVDVGTGRARLRYQAEGSSVTPSPDLERVAVVRALTPALSAIFAGPLNGTLTEVPRTRGAALPIGWTNDGWLLIVKNRSGSHDRVHAFRNGAERSVLTDATEGDPQYGQLLDRLSCSTIHAPWYLA